jgi:phosphatidate cytidylyltransferase
MAERPPTKSNLALRLLTAAPWVPLLIYVLYWAPRWAFPLLAATVCALGARELFRMVAPLHRALCVWGVIASVAVFALIAVESWSRYLAPGVVAITCLGMLVVLAAPEPMETAANRVGWAIAGPLYCGALFGALAQLFQREHGGSWVMLALFCAFWSDTAAYFVGRKFGKHRLSAVVSPKKSIEGSIGGLLGGVAGGLVAHFWLLPELSLLAAIVLSLVATAFGQAGDLCESLIKRSAGVKDSGAILPGHGGVLDRTDAMLFCSAVIWLYLDLLAY